jgi:formylglycine-generating enzyme required for sulfatase activity
MAAQRVSSILARREMPAMILRMELAELRQRLENLAEHPKWLEAEQLKKALEDADSSPRQSLGTTRGVFEVMIRDAHKQHFGETRSKPTETLVEDLVKANRLAKELEAGAKFIWNQGSNAIHMFGRVTTRDAYHALEYLFDMIEWRITNDHAFHQPTPSPTLSSPKPVLVSQGGKKARGADRIRELNPLERIRGRSLNFGLRESEINFLAEHTANRQLRPTRSTRLPKWAIPLGQLVGAVKKDDYPKVLAELFPLRGPFTMKQFQLSRYPVNNEQFKLFVDETGYKTMAERTGDEITWRIRFDASGPDHPVTVISFRDATEFCLWAGVRLPTRDEFERAVRGDSDSLYPWGPQWENDHCNDMFYVECQQTWTSPVNRFQDKCSSDGVCDLCGNVFEWVTAPNLQEGLQLIVGGAWDCASAIYGPAAYSAQLQIDNRAPNIGFRFASDLR